MSVPEKQMAAALTISTTLIVFNIIAVTQGSAEAYYTQIEQFLTELLPTL